MFFSVRELELRKANFDVDLAPGKLDFSDDELKQVSPLQATGVAELVSPAVGEIRVKGKYSVRIKAACDRCLEDSDFPIDREFDLVYRPDTFEGSEAMPGEAHLDADETEVGFYEGDGLELNEILREQVLLDLPMQRLCRPDCKGVCPYCGVNRNTTECQCGAGAKDDRWSALGGLKLKKGSE